GPHGASFARRCAARDGRGTSLAASAPWWWRIVSARSRRPGSQQIGETGEDMRLPGAASHQGFDTCSASDFEAVFCEAIAALEEAKVPHVLIGGLASAALGRPRCSADVDLLLRPRA